MPNEKSEFQEKEDARGNMIALKVREEEGEGIIIEWVNSNSKNTLISCIGDEKPMYDFIKKKYPDLNKAAGAGFAVWTENGILESIGEINGEKVGPLKREL